MFKILKRIWLGIIDMVSPATAKCGHAMTRVGVVDLHDETHQFEYSGDPNESPCCWDCFAKMSIQCAWCGEPILIDDPITLYTPRDTTDVAAHAVVYQKDPLQLVGCMAWECASTGADRAGFWTTLENGEPGVKRVLSPI